MAKIEKWKEKWEKKFAEFQGRENRPEWETNPQKYIDLLKVEPLATTSQPHLLRTLHDNNYKTMLECAFGGADDAVKIYEEFPDIIYTGIDRTEVFIDRANELFQFPNFNFLLANMEKMPFPDNSFDFVYGKYIFEHLPHYKTALKEMVRVAKKRVIVVFFKPLLPGELDEIHPNMRTTGVHENLYARAPLERFVRGLNCMCVFTIYRTGYLSRVQPEKWMPLTVTVMDVLKRG